MGEQGEDHDKANRGDGPRSSLKDDGADRGVLLGRLRMAPERRSWRRHVRGGQALREGDAPLAGRVSGHWID